MFLAELDHSPAAFTRELCLETSGLVVNSGMNDAAVAACLMEGELGFFFEEKNREPRLTPAQDHRGGKANNAPADNGAIKSLAGHGARKERSPQTLH